MGEGKPTGPLSRQEQLTQHQTMAEPGEQLPEEVLALIFRYLPLRDRAAAARVCIAWATAATCSAVWHDTNISCDCELKDMLSPYLSACLNHVHNLRLEFEPSRVQSRQAATELLTALAGCVSDPGLRSLRLECHGEKPLFDAGLDVLQAVHAICRASRTLHHLDLRLLPFTLDDALVLQTAHCCPELRSLFLNNRTLVGSVGPESVLELLKACPRLCALGLHLASLSHTALKALAAPDREPFVLLALRCACPEDARAPTLPDEAWIELRSRHPGLAVELELEPALPSESVMRILQPSVPVAALRLSLSGDTVGSVRFAACHYAATLRILEGLGPVDGVGTSLGRPVSTQCSQHLQTPAVHTVLCHPPLTPFLCKRSASSAAARRGGREGTGAGWASGDSPGPHHGAHGRFLPKNKGNGGPEKGGTQT
ncbi:F-box/LRR-repeat protein 8 [Manis javanica]|nr:F-box/LRR-repeat protein 8 [Manis javanica]